MAPTNEHRIISKAVTEGDVLPLVERRVDSRWFFNSKHRDALEFLLSHFSKYGTAPSQATFESHIGSTYVLFPVTESFEYLLDTQAEACRWQAANSAMPDVEDHLKAGRTEDAVSRIAAALSEIESFSPTASRVVDSMDNGRLAERWDEYIRREAKGGIIGYSTGFPTIDETTLGLQPGHLVTVLAQPKVGKTSICLAIANHVYRVHKVPVLFVSFEMGIREMELRQEAMMARVNFRHLQKATLSRTEKQRYADYLDLAESDYGWQFYFVDASSGSTVSAVRSHIERLDPGLVVIDGVYMLVDEQTGEANTPQALTNITRSLKRLATATKRPIIINTQALAWKSKGHRISMDSAGYSSSFAQDSDVVLGLERVRPGKDEDDDTYAYQRVLRVLASRNTGLTSVDLDFDYDEGRIEEAGS